VAEGLLRAWKPHWARWFIGENLTVVLAGHTPETTDWVRHPLLASVTLVGYAAVAVVAAALFFRTRDIAGAS
jgi:hypothetical protein